MQLLLIQQLSENGTQMAQFLVMIQVVQKDKQVNLDIMITIQSLLLQHNKMLV
jgi:hypothetical protein